MMRTRGVHLFGEVCYHTWIAAEVVGNGSASKLDR